MRGCCEGGELKEVDDEKTRVSKRAYGQTVYKAGEQEKIIRP